MKSQTALLRCGWDSRVPKLGKTKGLGTGIHAAPAPEGEAKGVVNLNFQLPEGDEEVDLATNSARSVLEGNSNYQLRCFGPKGMVTETAQGWVSREYREKSPRTHLSFNVVKDSDAPVRFVTVIVPTESYKDKTEVNYPSTED